MLEQSCLCLYSTSKRDEGQYFPFAQTLIIWIRALFDK